jgi:hypothetical protein
LIEQNTGLYGAAAAIAPGSGLEGQRGADFGQGSSLSKYILDHFKSFYTARLPFEERWRECLDNYLGQYRQERAWKPETEGQGGRSRVFVKLTTLKCNTAHAKLLDAMFTGRPDVPFELLPEGIDGLNLDQEMVAMVISQARERLKRHFRSIRLEEVLDESILEGCIFGTIILKGPVVEMRRRPVVTQPQIAGLPAEMIDADFPAFQVQYVDEPVPVIDPVSIWEYYTDPNAKSNLEAIGEIQFKRMLPDQFRQLARIPGYDAAAVYEAARRAVQQDAYDTRWIQLGDDFMGWQGDKDKRVSVLEWWGLVPAGLLRDEKIDVPQDIPDEEGLECLVVLAGNGLVIKACLNPLPRRPFYVCPVKKRPRTIYGMGFAELMRDAQKMINSAARLYVDNKALSGLGMPAINLDRIDLKRTRNLDLYAGKAWFVKGNFAPRDAIDLITFPDVTLGLRDMIELWERWSDEETGLPKYTSGEQGSFLNKTATGMSMLMTAANINLKPAMRNIDNYLIEPIVETYHTWFSEIDPTYSMGLPMKAKATGTDSLVAKEIRMEQIMKFMQITSAPQDAMFIDRIKLMKRIAGILEAGDLMRTDEEIKGIMAQLTQQATTPKDMKEYVALDKLYPYLTRNEQAQVLMSLGIQPDQNPSSPPEALPGAGIGNPPPPPASPPGSQPGGEMALAAGG